MTGISSPNDFGQLAGILHHKTRKKTAMALKLSLQHEQEAAQYNQALAQLRIRVFREFPYLYDGDPHYEARYLKTFFSAPDSILVLVQDDERVVGASTGLPFEHETPELKQPFIEAGQDPSRIFYFGESVLLPAYRGRGWGVEFFRQRENWARKLGRFALLTFCAVQRPADHPRRPFNYRPLDGFWKKRGFHPTGKSGTIAWKDLDEKEETAKPMKFWEKRIG